MPLRLRRRSCAPRPGLCLKGGPGLVPPRGNRALVALARPPDRLLHTQPFLPQQAADMRRMIAHAEAALDHRRHALGGPHLPNKAIRFRAPCQDVRQAGSLRLRQLWRGTGRGVAAQRLDPTSACALQPATDRRPAHRQRRRNVFPSPSLLMQVPGAQSSPLSNVLATHAGGTHAARCTRFAPDSQTYAATSNASAANPWCA
jgi:hypothetical protein